MFKFLQDNSPPECFWWEEVLWLLGGGAVAAGMVPARLPHCFSPHVPPHHIDVKKTCYEF